MSFIFSPAKTNSASIRGHQERFPVRRIYCVGRNYADHAIEMGHNPDKEPPFFFQKNPDNLLLDGADFPYPSKTQDVHHEIELVAALGKGGANISVKTAMDHIFGYAVGLDMTRRDLQAEVKKMGRPWDIAKAFEHSAPMSGIVSVSEIGHPSVGEICLDVNGVRKQSGNLGQMIWKTSEIISYLSKLFTLAPGDLIFTGTPAGVGPVQRGDLLEGHIVSVGSVSTLVV